MSTPLVSICIPTFNYAMFLGDALTSARAQTCADIEIIVSDNCSTDDTPRLMAEWARRDPRIRYHRNERNIGMQGNFNRCLQLAVGKHIKFLCADDVLEPACVQRMVEVLESRSDVALVACRREITDGGLRRLGYLAYPGNSRFVPGTDVIRRCFFRGNLIGEPTAVMFRKSQGGRGFNDAYSQVFDLEMWFHLLEHGSFAYIPEPLCKFRRHQAQGTRGNLGSARILADRQRLFREFAPRPYLRGDLAQKLLWDLRMAWLLCRDTGAADVSSAADVSRAVYFPRLLRPLFWAARRIGALGTARAPR